MSKKKNTVGSAIVKFLSVAALGGAVFIPGLDLLAGPALIALLVSYASGGEK